MKTFFSFFPFLITILFIQPTTAQKSINVETFNLSQGAESSVKVDFGNSVGSVITYGLHLNSKPLTSSQKGGLLGIVADTYSDYSLQTGFALGRMATSKAFAGDGSFIGVGGYVSSTALRNANSKFSNLLAGDFRVEPNTNVTLNGNNFWVAGVKASIEGTINYTSNTNSQGAVAALIAIDESQGTANSWAGYFKGKSYLSDKTIIGTMAIPNTASTFDVSAYNLFVTGGILTEECLVVSEDQWADYVFEESYQLTPLPVVESFITANGHLPNIPAGEFLDKNGIPLAKMTILQQEKIEELFLYSIQLNKENKQLKAENKVLKNRLDKIEQRLLALEK